MVCPVLRDKPPVTVDRYLSANTSDVGFQRKARDTHAWEPVGTPWDTLGSTLDLLNPVRSTRDPKAGKVILENNSPGQPGALFDGLYEIEIRGKTYFHFSGSAPSFSLFLLVFWQFSKRQRSRRYSDWLWVSMKEGAYKGLIPVYKGL